MALLINLSGVGAQKTGLGVYAAMCGRVLEAEFVARTLHSASYRPIDSLSLESPSNIALGAGKMASVRRYRFLSRLQVSDDTLVYTPSHHYVSRARRQIITVADLISLHHPSQHLAQSLFFRTGVPVNARRAAAVFTISSAMKAELCDAFGLSAERVHVISPAICTDVFSPSQLPLEPPARPFLFCVGGRYPHKNVGELIERHALWSSRFSLKVASCTGAYRRELEAQVARLGLQTQVDLLGYVAETELITLYRQCTALVYPSKTEGFGIPPLEALACGSPVIVSDIPVHREVCGDAAIFVQLGSLSSWSAAFDALADPDLIASKLFAARGRLATYSPAAIAGKLVEAVEAVAAHEGVFLERR